MNDLETRIIVSASNDNRIEEAKDVALGLKLDFTSCTSFDDPNCVYLDYGAEAVKLICDGLEYYGDYRKLEKRIKPNTIGSEMLVKAARIKGISKGLKLIDATAGLGEDSFILAASGFEVTLFEQDRIIFELLKDTVDRALKDPALCVAASRMNVIYGNSVEKLKDFANKCDIILLDPMFPERQKSGLVHKKFQLIHHLEKPCDNEEILLDAALKTNPQKIVIKRPLKGPNLGGIKPSYSLKGKAIRYDCVVVRTT